MRSSAALLLVIALPALAQDTDTYPSDVVNAYYRLCKPMVTTTPEMTPPAAARVFGYMGVALYEAVVPGMPGHASLQTQLPELGPLFAVVPGQAYHWPTAASHALCLMMDSLFFNMTPQLRADLYAVRDGYDAQFAGQAPLQTIVRSQAFGQAIALGVLDMARTDGGHRSQLGTTDPNYVPPVGPGLWIPEGGQTALLPRWGENRPFLAADTTSAASAPGPPPFSTAPGSTCHDAALDVYNAVLNITTWQLTTVSYWADGQLTPGGHSIQMLEQLTRREGRDLAFAARGYAMMGIALSDAFLTCWRSKYRHSWQRPRNHINLYIDPDWNTWIPTPPFPDYTSGHSTQSGAWAAVMTELFGDPFTFVDSTHGPLHGGPRTYADFRSAAEETALSRFWAGLHFAYANNDGLDAGAAVAANVIALFNGLATGLPAPVTGAPLPRAWAANGVLQVNSITGPWNVHDAMGRILLSGNGEGAFALPAPAGAWCVLRGREGAVRFVHLP